MISFSFRFDLDFWEWVEEIDWYTYWNAMYVVMIAMMLHAINSMITGYATFTQSRALLIVSVILRYIIHKDMNIFHQNLIEEF